MKRRVDPDRPSINVTVGDPQKVGDPINAHIVYTVHTTTSSPNLFRKVSFSVLRRYSDFLWLCDALCLSNPGVIVPPVPEKHSFGRFEETFVETRRQALNKCIQKIVDHPLLYTDPALKLFLESDSFAMDIKHRKTEVGVNPSASTPGLMATIGSTLTGPKFIENDDWFENRKIYLDALESQFRGLIKAIEAVSKQRADVVTAANELSQAVAELAQSGLSKQLSHSVSMLREVESRVKDLQESQAKDDIMTFLAGIDEYTRLIGSIRLAFMSRERVYLTWQNAEADVRKVRAGHEKAKRQGKLPSDTTGVSLAQLSAAERRALDSKTEFESVTKLVKSEIARFEQERIEDFKDSLEMFLENMIHRQKEASRKGSLSDDSSSDYCPS
ncbi:Vps5-domain-containing protein [Dacryopinax primogenitus]|uniref:Vps5-domain-containing protein n=1 Tax=Dacryopinax primogenitus (strain DJM 731) TaxID=1858805 RepID=M5G6G2_DACPD|nr:Vps5-domain-containing protein [Dacryopinax primogenitus]EJU03795.1 Vps5-domain-containing protein [Dacryopinax primogenitus]